MDFMFYQKTKIICGGPWEQMDRNQPRFMLDRDHIFYSKAFRRLAGKAQVYITGEDENKRTRLTHTLEVSQIARPIAQMLGLDVDLVEAIALGHDLGHTPFGHAGERILHEIMTVQDNHPLGMPCPLDKANYKPEFEKFLGFKHNLQSVVVAAQLEKSCDNRGLNLTEFTLYGMQAHSDSMYKEGKVSNHDQLGFYDKYLRDYCWRNGNPAWSLEALLAAQADEIAQWHHDMEDALLGGLITPRELVGLMQPILDNAGDVAVMTEEEKEVCLNPEQYDLGVFTSVFCRNIVWILMAKLAEIAHKKLQDLGKPDSVEFPGNVQGNNSKTAHVYLWDKELEFGKIKDIFSYKVPGDAACEAFAKAVKNFSKEILPRVLSSHEIQMNDAKGQYIIQKLFQAYYANPRQLPDHCVFEFLSQYNELKQDTSLAGCFRSADTQIDSEKELRAQAQSKGIGSVRRIFFKLFDDRKERGVVEEVLLMRTICNYIACMTDSEAKKTYQAIYL